MIKRLAFSVYLILCVLFTFAQVTTSSVEGIARDSRGVVLVGASVSALHVPSGTRYSTITRAGGQFNIPNMRVGGPYKIEISYVGFVTRAYEDINLQLGITTQLNPALEDNSKSLDEVKVIYRKNPIINRERQGPSLQVSQQELQTLPSVTRNVNDFARFVPQAQARSSASDGSTVGISFAGQSNKYNQFTIDGANATDVFGLAASGTNGGQASINPIPFDAIEQVQVILAPYDVTLGGFTGGGVNAVTRSGSNNFHGSIYGFNQNQGFVGKSADTKTAYGDFKDWTYGGRLGGALIKNKLFFFVNYEGENRTAPVDFLPGSPSSGINVGNLQTLSDFLKDKTKHPAWIYDPGAFNGFNKTRKSDAVFARIDWNINDKNKLTIRHSFVQGSNFILTDAQNSMSFQNNGYNFKTTNNSTVIELNSNISSKYSNILRLTYNATRDKRASPGAAFPSVTINDAGATYNFGQEFSSQANSLNQDNWTLTDNFTIYARKHTLTIGTNNAFYNATDVFLQGVNGSYTYGSLAGFYGDSVLNSYQTNYSTKGKGDLAPYTVHAAQFGLYVQDAFRITDKFKLTYGLRADVPVFFNKPDANDYFNSSALATSNGVATNKVPKPVLLLSPRVGFNWDVMGDRSTQIRGGVGIFTGRIPLVWIANQYTKTGIATLGYKASNPAAVQAGGIHFDPVTPPHQILPTPGSTPPATEIDVTNRNFKFPRTLRANLAIDQKLPFGVIGTLEGIYTKTIQDILYHDLNLAPSTGTYTLGNTTRPFYGKVNDPNFGNVIELGNTTKGYSYNITLQLQRPFTRGWTASIAYTYGHSEGLNDGTSSTALSNYRFAYNINGLNNLDQARNNYDMGSRVVGYVAKKFKYGKFATNIGLAYNGQSGQTLSYVYFGDVNGDDGTTRTSANTSNSADLIYLPTDASQFTPLTVKTGTVTTTYTAAQQFQMFQDYMNSDKYLRDHQGKNTSRNGGRLPWENHFDLKISEDFYFYKGHTITVSADIFNIGNLFNNKWGHAYYSSNQELQPLNLAAANKWVNSTTPTFTFNPAFGLNSYTNKPWAYANFLSRWNMQLGIRYSF